MTWGELKAKVESNGITDETSIVHIDIGMGREDVLIVKIEGNEAMIYD